MVDLNDMALFVEVVKARSFRRAAEVINVPNSTLSRRISSLEKSIGLRLLHRTTRRLELTEAGQIYFDRSRRIVDEARLAHEELGGILDQPTGLLRVSLPADFAHSYLAPIIVEFAENYPGITFDFDFTPRRVDLVAEPYDVAIRLGEQEPSHLIARPLAVLTNYFYASPGYLERQGEPTEPLQLSEHQCICMGTGRSWTLGNASGSLEVPVHGKFRMNSVAMVRRFGTLDMGIINLPEQTVLSDLEAGTLRRVLPDWEGGHISVYAVTETRLIPAKTQRFIELLRQRLR